MVKLIGNQHDRYGRTVAQIVLENGININYEIVKNGYAWQYLTYSHNMELAGLKQHARQNKLGLWQDANPTPPWNFRKGEKSQRVQKKTAKKPKRHYKKRKPKHQDTIAF
jgi:micrococcal nuclease